MWKRHTRNLDALEGSITSDRRAQKVVKHPAVRRAQKIKQKYKHTNKKQQQQKKLFLELFSAHLLGGIFSIYTPIPFSYANIIIISPWRTRKGDWSQMFTATVYHLCTVNCSMKVSNLPLKKYFSLFFFLSMAITSLKIVFQSSDNPLYATINPRECNS